MSALTTDAEVSSSGEPIFVGEVEETTIAQFHSLNNARPPAFVKNPASALVHNVLSISSGVAYYPNRPLWIGFKGGSVSGVLTLTFLVDRTDGRTFVLSIGTNDGHAKVDVEAIVALATKTIATLSTLSWDRGVAFRTLEEWTR